MGKKSTEGQVFADVSLVGHRAERFKQSIEFALDPVGEIHATGGDATPDLKKIVLSAETW